MHSAAENYFSLPKEGKKRVQIALCSRAYEAWLCHATDLGPVEYRESVAGTMQQVDRGLPRDAIHAAATGRDDTSVEQRYLEPLAAMQDGDLGWSAAMDTAYYAIFNLYQFHVAEKLTDSWVIVNQALSALGEENAAENLRAAVEYAEDR